jgi:uncharacterized protein
MHFKNILNIFLFFCFLPLTLWGNPWGKDGDLAFRCKEEPENTCQPPHPCNFSPGVAVSTLLIRFHQTCITQIDGPRSHYLPSSSQYTLDAIQKYGFFKGFVLGCDRLLRENDEKWIYPVTLDKQGQVIKWDPVR